MTTPNADEQHRGHRRGEYRPVEVNSQHIRRVGPKAVEGTMRQVQNACHAEDKGETHRQHGVDRARDGTVHENV